MRRMVLLMIALAGLSCRVGMSVLAGPPPQKGERALALAGDHLTPGQPEEQAALDLLARGYLVRGKSVTEGFGYYAYLVFLDAGESTRPQRENAIRAFTRLLEDGRELESLQVPRERLAVLYVPVKQDPGTAAAPESVLSLYDYSMAQFLTVEIERRGVTLPRLFLLGSASPIQPRATNLPADLRVVELKGDQQAIEATLLRFRSTLLAPATPTLASTMLERVRAFFDSVGGFVLSVGTVGGSPSKP